VESVIALVRVGLASSSLFAVWLDPAEPGRYAELTYALHGIYLFYAITLAAFMWNRDSRHWGPVATHWADIAVASVFQYLTLGPSSPFFTYFTFSLFSAALRWGWRETIRTAVIVLGAFVVMGISLSRTLGPTEFELSRFVIRISYLTLVAVVLVCLGRYEERLRDEIQRLARWPLPVAHAGSAGVIQVLEHAAGVIGSRRALVLWSTDEEPWSYLVSWPSAGGAVEKIAPGAVEPPVPDQLQDATFVASGALDADLSLDVSRGGAVSTWRGDPVHAALRPRLGSTGIASASFRTDRLSGRVFFTDIPPSSPEILSIVEVVGREVGVSLDQLHFHERARQRAVSGERIRVARDLHDGVLQSLTGIRLELQDMAKTGVQGGASSADSRLLGLERALALEQRELRRFIESLKPSPLGSARSLADRLDELRRRIGLEWRAAINIHVHPLRLSVGEEYDRVVPLMVHEAIVNALKHGGPSEVTVDVLASDGTLRIVVTDDGRGFAFTGRVGHAQLTRTNTGPISLRERVSALGGEIAIESGPSGSRVEMSIPLQASHV
jgi:signal transduction histidine kinase